ncbi:hypothetical protein BJV78DRAFT_1155834 [Lactifluus subvellereus]|nr:hypothetical protein BJV78DRAFT_1155834 [Lactifluus subvellereus]
MAMWQLASLLYSVYTTSTSSVTGLVMWVASSGPLTSTPRVFPRQLRLSFTPVYRPLHQTEDVYGAKPHSATEEEEERLALTTRCDVQAPNHAKIWSGANRPGQRTRAELRQTLTMRTMRSSCGAVS